LSSITGHLRIRGIYKAIPNTQSKSSTDATMLKSVVAADPRPHSTAEPRRDLDLITRTTATATGTSIADQIPTTLADRDGNSFFASRAVQIAIPIGPTKS